MRFYADMGSAVVRRPVDPETEPEAIADDQRRDVARAYRQWGLDVAMISESVDLDRWIVTRRLSELGVEVEILRITEPTGKNARRGTIQAAVLLAITRLGTCTVEQLATALDRNPGDVRKTLNRLWHTQRVEKVAAGHGGKTWTHTLWRARDEGRVAG